MATAPVNRRRTSTPEERSESLREQLAAREAGRTIKSPGSAASSGEAARALDTFESAAAVALKDAVRPDDDELQGEFESTKDLTEDEQTLAGNFRDPLAEEDEDAHPKLPGEEDEDEEEDSSLFSNPGKERLAGLVGSIFEDANAGTSTASGPGDPANRPGREDLDEDSEEAGMGDQILGTGSIKDMISGRQAETLEEVSIMTTLLGEMADTTTSKTSVAQGNDPLSDAVNSVTQADRDAAAKAAGVTTSSSGGSGAADPAGGAAPTTTPAPAAKTSWYVSAANAVSQKVYGRDFMGDAGTGGTGLGGNRNEKEQASRVVKKPLVAPSKVR